MISMEKTLKVLEEADIRQDVKVIIGGAPVTEDYAQQIGADGFAQDASSAARVVSQLLG
jgi:5-methyltetrahydrofolate--homocysteine methyltransferase